MSRRPGHPVNRGVRRALAAKRIARARWVARRRAERVLAIRDAEIGNGWCEVTCCETCGRRLTDSHVSRCRSLCALVIGGGGEVLACRECQRYGVNSDPGGFDFLPYCAGGTAGPLAGPRAALPGGVQ